MNIHFIGIGGIGVSALAKYYLKHGCKVSGSDLSSSEITDGLKKSGAKISIGPQKAENLPEDVEMAVYSPAVKKDNQELKRAFSLEKKNKILVKSYPEALGDLTKKYFTIAISGTHGKSTTTAMIGLLLAKAGFDPTVIVGTKLKEFGNSNCRIGKSNYLVIEADEHFGSFLNYWPKIIVLTNIGKDHLDYYKNLSNILKTFKKYVLHLPKDGVLVANKDDRNVLKIRTQSLKLQFKIQDYTLKQKEAKKLREILKIPGEHNISNALAALTVARILKIRDKISFKSLSEFKGSWRRFEIERCSLKKKKIIFVSDYAHHPTEISATLKAAREKWPRNKILLIFQPHHYQRVFYLFKSFVGTFKEILIEKWVDNIFITDIYDVAGRESKKIKKKIDSKALISAIKNSFKKSMKTLSENISYISSNSEKDSQEFREITNRLKQNLKGGEVVIVMGAGSIYRVLDGFRKKNKFSTKKG